MSKLLTNQLEKLINQLEQAKEPVYDELDLRHLDYHYSSKISFLIDHIEALQKYIKNQIDYINQN